MSDQRPEWMPSEDEISAATYADQKEHESGQPNTEDLIRRTCLRAVTLAKIEAWEEMRSMFNGPSLQVIIREKIAALRKELEG